MSALRAALPWYSGSQPRRRTQLTRLQVLVWTGLAGGDNEYCAILVALNSVLQIVLYAPLAILFIDGISRPAGKVNVSYSVVATSVAVFLG